MSDVKPARPVEALLTLRGEGMSAVGRERIAMLEAAAEQGSITGAAKALGFSYKSVWDGINAINNLMPRPVLIGRTGGAGGGGAVLTEEGRALILGFRRLEEKLSRISAALLEEGEDIHPDLPLWGIAMKTSARNAFRCRVREVRREAVDVEVVLDVTDGHALTAIITNDSADDLELAPGRDVIALIKASFVMLAPADEAPRRSGGNCFSGIVMKRIDGDAHAEIVLDIGEGKTLTSVVAKADADLLHLTAGAPACALFSAGHVILAVG
jgi:molybdate transport system regulatory protein